MEAQCHVVAGAFPDRQYAQKSLADLHHAGFTRDEIGIVTKDTCTAPGGKELKGNDIERKHAVEGAGLGAIAGTGLGGLIGLGVVAGVVPVIGQVLVGGILAAGLAAGGILGALTGLGIPEYEARYYECEVKAGRTVVTVRTQKNIEEAIAILNHHGASTYRPTASTEPALT
jgi:uncharacterized membrane protein